MKHLRSTAALIALLLSGPVALAQNIGNSTDISGTVTAGGTYQTVLASNGMRKGCLIENPTTATEVISVKVGTMATPFTVSAGGVFLCQGTGVTVTDTITLTAATTGHAWAGTAQ